jgi:hypothetical protein
MAVTYPRSDLFPRAMLAAGSSFRLQGYTEEGRTAGGLFLSTNLADPVWVAQYVTTSFLTVEEARELAAKLHDLVNKGERFVARHPVRLFPRAYPTGAFTDSGVIDNLPSDTSQIRLASLPADFVIRIGDMFSFQYGASSKFRALHMAVEDVTANGAGTTTAFNVTPHIRTGATTSTAVVFKQPSCYMKVIPGSIQDEYQNDTAASVRFSAVQDHAIP